MVKLLLRMMMNSEHQTWHTVRSVEATFMKMRNTTMTKKISKVIVYYDDGTYEEVKTGAPNIQDQTNKNPASPPVVMPDFRPDIQKMKDWTPSTPYQPTYVTPSVDPTLPPWTVTCSTGNVPLNYTVTSDACNMEMPSWSFTSTGNADNLNKYTITSTGNGNVDLSK